MDIKSTPRYYGRLLGEIKKRLRSAQYDALRAVNKELVALYWDIGRMIAERQRTQAWGKSVVEEPARDLQSEFPGIRGFSARDLWRMQAFYVCYHDKPFPPPLVAEIGWTHNVAIMENCKDPLDRF